LIRATIHEPDWIFCDEPTAGLDPVAAADMRHYLAEQRERGAALIVTTHMLGEAELMADRIAIMRRGVVVTAGTLEGLRRRTHPGPICVAPLAADPADIGPIEGWLAQHALGHQVQAGILSYTLPWESAPRERADFAAALQTRLAEAGAPFHELEEQES